MHSLLINLTPWNTVLINYLLNCSGMTGTDKITAGIYLFNHYTYSCLNYENILRQFYCLLVLSLCKLYDLVCSLLFHSINFLFFHLTF